MLLPALICRQTGRKACGCSIACNISTCNSAEARLPLCKRPVPRPHDLRSSSLGELEERLQMLSNFCRRSRLKAMMARFYRLQCEHRQWEV